ncbi:MAG: hypothetical protein IT348_04430 [Candidatus Eisenbacteria bacterium]|nr:hypothetical protein [Candidatus Eisenbacteria bacterium]
MRAIMLEDPSLWWAYHAVRDPLVPAALRIRTEESVGRALTRDDIVNTLLTHLDLLLFDDRNPTSADVEAATVAAYGVLALGGRTARRQPVRERIAGAFSVFATDDRGAYARVATAARFVEAWARPRIPSAKVQVEEAQLFRQILAKLDPRMLDLDPLALQEELARYRPRAGRNSFGPARVAASIALRAGAFGMELRGRETREHAVDRIAKSIEDHRRNVGLRTRRRA